MPRASRSASLFPIALSPAQAADALMVRAEDITALLRVSDMPVFKLGTRRRILVADLVEAVRAHWPRVEIAKRLESAS